MWKLTKLSKVESKPSKIAAFDIETIDWIHPYALGFYDGKSVFVFEGFDCVGKFVDFVLQKRYRNTLIYAHNGGKFDFNFILKSLVGRNLKVEIMRIGSRVAQITVKDKNRNCWVFRDSMGFFGQLGKKSSLASLSDNFSVEHKKGELDHTKINFANWRSMEKEWKPYLIDDCKALYEVMTAFQDYVMNKFQVNLRKNITIAQLAMNIFRSNFMKESISNHRAVEADIRKSYKGGRVEIFQQHCEDANYYDINSLYPYVMKNKPMPVGSPIKSYCFKVDDFGVCLATVEAPKDLNIPLLPHKLKSGKLVFPTGRFSGWFCSPELQKARDVGYKIKVQYGYKFQKDFIFTEYVDELYKIKQTSERDSVSYMVSKLLMNSLYGKFGQRREKKKVVLNKDSIIGSKEVMRFFFEERVESKSNHILPAIASFVTSYARLELYKYLQNNEPIYCDTDSIVTKKKLTVGDELGDLKLEHELKEGWFLLPKMYALKDANSKIFVKCKGFSKNDVDYQMIKDAIITGNNSIKYERDKFALVFESLKRNKDFVSMVHIKRTVKAKYDKRTVIDKGQTVPLHIDDMCNEENIMCNEEHKYLNSNDLLLNKQKGSGGVGVKS